MAPHAVLDVDNCNQTCLFGLCPFIGAFAGAYVLVAARGNPAPVGIGQLLIGYVFVKFKSDKQVISMNKNRDRFH